jgi:hypothetical protein
VAFGVVMDGTAAVPSQYSGRAGIPAFLPVGKVIVLRFSCLGLADGSYDRSDHLEGQEENGRECFRRLSAGRCACLAGAPVERSSVALVWLLVPDGSACGCLEDTRRAKRLLTDDGEMISAHLSCFAWREVRAGAELLRAALGRAAALGFPALFTSVDERDAAGLLAALELEGVEVIQAPATVYGYALPAGMVWNVNSSEI